jgi:hypothetical protein
MTHTHTHTHFQCCFAPTQIVNHTGLQSMGQNEYSTDSQYLCIRNKYDSHSAYASSVNHRVNDRLIVRFGYKSRHCSSCADSTLAQKLRSIKINPGQPRSRALTPMAVTPLLPSTSICSRVGQLFAKICRHSSSTDRFAVRNSFLRGHRARSRTIIGAFIVEHQPRSSSSSNRHFRAISNTVASDAYLRVVWVT